MAKTSAPVSLEEYFDTSYEPECEYVAGELLPKALATTAHGALQARLGYLRYRYEEAGLCRAYLSLSLQVRERVIYIPDACLLSPDNKEHGIVSTPPLLCIEVLSPSDRFGYMMKKLDELFCWGVPACWILDPEDKKASVYDAEGLHPVPVTGVLRTGSFELALTELWA